jgi:hypothetical protein
MIIEIFQTIFFSIINEIMDYSNISRCFRKQKKFNNLQSIRSKRFFSAILSKDYLEDKFLSKDRIIKLRD